MTSEQANGERAHGPRHVAIIMDGNGRWAQRRGLTRADGHEAGTENISPIIRACPPLGIEYLTLYAFSTENWTRPKLEVNALIRLLGRVLDRELGQLHANGIRLLHLGDLDVLPEQLQRRVTDAIGLTAGNTGMTVSLAFNYGGRAEIIRAVRRIVADGVPGDSIDEATIRSYLYTSGVPDPDLIIRTGGDMRLSNFLLWQAAYAEFYATDTYWPDFGREEIDRALRAFALRDRRFGAAPNANGARPHRSGRR